MIRNVYRVCARFNECIAERGEKMYFFIPCIFALHFILIL